MITKFAFILTGLFAGVFYDNGYHATGYTLGVISITILVWIFTLYLSGTHIE